MTAFLAQMVMFVILALIGGLVTYFLQRTKRVEAGRITQPASLGTPGSPAQAAQTMNVARQRPSGLVMGLSTYFLVPAVVLALIGIFIPDNIAKVGMVLIGLLTAAVGLYVLQCYRNCSLVDGPNVTILTDWRGRETQLRHNEITQYYYLPRQRTVVVKDMHKKKHTIALSWYSTPMLGLQVARMEAEGRFAGKNMGRPNKVANRIQTAEWSFRITLPNGLKEVLAMGPGSYPARFQRDPAAPAGQGWAGPEYERWLAGLNAAMGS